MRTLLAIYSVSHLIASGIHFTESGILLEHVIGPNGLLSTKARIVSTNSITSLNQFDQLLYLRRGVIQECGPLQVLQSNPQSHIGKLM